MPPGASLVAFNGAKDDQATNRDGRLLVGIVTLQLVALDLRGATLTAPVPPDEALCGLEWDLQALLADPGASKGVAFTPGLELIVGF